MTTKYYIILIYCCLGIYETNAQLSIGLQGGYTKAWEDYEDTELPEGARVHVNGFNLSTTMYYSLDQKLKIGVEPGIIRRGAACEPGFIIFNNDTKLLLNYVQFPAYLSFNIFETEQLNLFCKTGFSASMISSATREIIDLSGNNPATITKLNVKNNAEIERWDNGIHGGFGIAYLIGNNEIFITSDFYYGLKDVDFIFPSKNRNVNLNIGYNINL